MLKLSSMYTLLLYLLLSTNVLCNRMNHNKSKNNNPFWINPCGYTICNGEDYGDSDANIIDRILVIEKQCQQNIDLFKSEYIQRTFNTDYNAHYNRWTTENNSWMTSRLLNKPEDNMPPSSLESRSFPSELNFTYELLQRVSVGYEILLDDANNFDYLENNFLNDFTTCKNDLQQLLCEISDDIADQDKPKDITRDQVPNDVRQETNFAERNLTNSIIFRDYMIAIKYVKNTYEYLRSKCKNYTFHVKRRFKKKPHNKK